MRERRQRGRMAVFGIAAMGFGLSVWANATNDWVTAPGNTPATAYEWSDGQNWKSGVAPGDREVIRFFSLGRPLYVRLPDEVAISKLLGNYNVVLLGERVVLSGASANDRATFQDSVRIYADLLFGTERDSTVPWFGGVNVAGRLIADKWNVTPAWDWTNHRLDWYATSANPRRTDDVQLAEGILYHPGSGHVAFYAPQGSEGCTGTWRQTSGSPFLERVSETAHPISVGTVVTGAGIPAGTYVRCRFESNLIELSAPVTETIDANEVSFTAFTPDVRVSIPLFSRQGTGATRFKLFKYRAQDGLRVELGRYWAGSGQRNEIGLTGAECKTWTPGTHVVHEAAGGPSSDILLNCHLELAGLADGRPTTFPAARAWCFAAAGDTARVTVTNGISAVVGTVTNWIGTIVKDGGGTLTLGMGNAVNAGALAVEAGTVTLDVGNLDAGVRPRLGTLRLSSGAMLQLPAAGLSVGTLDVSDGAVVSGPGELVVDTQTVGRDFGAVELTNGATIHIVGVGLPSDRFRGGKSAPEPAVVGHPAFWLDASKPETIVYRTENGTNFVTRWNDCRTDEPMFCTNLVRCPQFINGDLMTNKYVRIGRRTESEYITNTEALVWSVPLKDVRAVFLVQDPSEGGGELLGRVSWRLGDAYYGSRGGPYYRGGNQPWSGNIYAPAYSTPCVSNGWCYLNGRAVIGTKAGYLGPFMQLVEHHVNPDVRASPAHKELWCDAFGVGYVDYPDNGKSKFLADHNGGMRIAEYIIYTNSLTYTERAQVAQYLSQKWLGKEAIYEEWNPTVLENGGRLAAADETFEVVDGQMYVAGEVSGEGGLTKTGGGVLYVDELPSGHMTVAEGEVIVNSYDLSDASFPSGAWLHVDASRTDTVERTANGLVTKWHDVGGKGHVVTPLAAGKSATWTPDALNGRAVVDTGVIGQGAGLRICKSDDTGYGHGGNDVYDGFLESPRLRTVFVVHGSQNGGGSLLGCWGPGYPSMGFPHNTTDPTAPMITLGHEQQYWWGVSGFAAAVSNGTDTVRLNGVAVDPFTQSFSGGYDLFAYRGKDGRKSDTLACYGQNAGQMGGLEYAEVVAYERQLNDDEFSFVEAILNWKWFNRQTSGYYAAMPAALDVAVDAKITVVGSGRITVERLSGGGTIDGDVIVPSGGVFRAEVAADGTVAGGLVVTGRLEATQGGTIELTGAVSALKPGRYVLATAEDHLAFGGTWTCDLTRRDLKATLVQDGDAVVLRVFAACTQIIFR